LVRFQPDDAPFFLPLQLDLLAVIFLTHSFVAFCGDVFPGLCRLAGLENAAD
jgi:hypothetical protein